MAQAGYEDLLSRIQEAEVVSLCRDLVRFKSVNPPGDELEIAEYVAGVLREAGLTAEVVPHTPTRASVLARLKGSGEMPALLYTGHLDVVPVGAEEWLHDPFGGEVVEGRLWGRGSTDMKGGDAAMITAAKVLAAANLPLKGDLILAITAGEEGEQLGATELAARPDLAPVQAVVVAEPSYNDVYVAEKGVCWLKITTHGKTAHGSMPHLGQNAIMMMIALLTELDSLAVPYEEHPLLGRFTRSINTIAGGVATNVVPDQCVVTIDQRTVPGQDHHAMPRQVEELISDLGRRLPDFRASVEVINDRIPVATSPEDPVVQRFYDVVAEVAGERPVPKGVNYYTDAVVFAPALKAPMIICGPGDANLAHQPNEYVEVEKMVEAAKIFTLAAAQLLT
ncbi:MAG: M20 family metallopeptidase [Chloroflexi bacterium]|nr:M20 family metallopeptidase [Chloroflexota bacterium]